MDCGAHCCSRENRSHHDRYIHLIGGIMKPVHGVALASTISFVLALTACAGGAQTVVTVTATPSDPVAAASPSIEPVPESSDPVVDDPSESSTPSPTETFTEIPFGESLSVKSGDNGGETVTLGKPVLAECQYSSIGCDDPEVGERVVEIPITIVNDGTETVEWGSDYFILEFADGTQMSTGDGAAFDYTPDNYMDYDVKVRPGSTYKSVLVFEAPKGPFKVLILSGSYDGEPFAAWF